eukprot:SAG31_NODE_31922_length_362_cov_0.946768_1_plen_47_part_01
MQPIFKFSASVFTVHTAQEICSDFDVCLHALSSVSAAAGCAAAGGVA